MIVRQRQPREECPAFLAFVRRKLCCACGAPPKSQAAHIRFTDPRYPEKRRVGIGEKPDDRWAVPLCSSCHLDAPDAQHQVGEAAFWERVGLNPFLYASTLWMQFGRRQNRTPEMRNTVKARAVRIRTRKKRQAKSSFVQYPKSQSIKSANRWPPKGSRKFNGEQRR